MLITPPRDYFMPIRKCPFRHEKTACGQSQQAVKRGIKDGQIGQQQHVQQRIFQAGTGVVEEGPGQAEQEHQAKEEVAVQLPTSAQVQQQA